ncbi:MAG: hypothetical protein PHV59_09055, partial [Victivallales bacterium]|nr:hypothetical protein [Victivallales bacterium]
MNIKKLIPALKYTVVLLPFTAVLITVGITLSWGLPNKTVNAIVLPENIPEKEKIIRELADLSDTNIKERSSFVIDKQTGTNTGQRKLRIARRYLMYTENPDEMLSLAGLAGIEPGKFRFKLKCFQYGGGYLYPMGTMIAAGKILSNENLYFPVEKLLKNPERIASAYIWGRALNILALAVAFAGLAMIFSACGFPRFQALLAGGVVISVPAVINWAGILKPHLLGVSFLLLSTGVAMSGQKLKHLKTYFRVAMILAGFACSAQYLMVGAGIIPCLLVLQNKTFGKLEKFKIIVGGILLAGITFLVFNPYFLLNMNTVLADIKRAASFYDPDFFSFKIPGFALKFWLIGSGLITVPLTAGLFFRSGNRNF